MRGSRSSQTRRRSESAWTSQVAIEYVHHSRSWRSLFRAGPSLRLVVEIVTHDAVVWDVDGGFATAKVPNEEGSPLVRVNQTHGTERCCHADHLPALPTICGNDHFVGADCSQPTVRQLDDADRGIDCSHLVEQRPSLALVYALGDRPAEVASKVDGAIIRDQGRGRAARRSYLSP